jgi:RNA polymerase sigma-70 factor (ECF subfamily)
MSELDPATVAACRRGDERAFRRLVDAHRQPVVALCVALAGADGEDLAQETFVRVFRAIDRFDPGGPATLRSWILCIARRLCHDRARHLRRTPEVGGVTADAVDPAASPIASVLGAEASSRVARAFAALPDEQRAVLALREWEGLDYQEIAVVEGVPVGTVRSRLARARDALKAALGAGDDAAAVGGRRRAHA